MKLYTKTICPKCIGVKATIEQSDLAVAVINIDNDEAAASKLRNANLLTVPVLEKDGVLIHDLNEIYAALEQ